MSSRLLLAAILPFGVFAFVGPCGHVGVPNPTDVVSGGQKIQRAQEEQKKCKALAQADIILPEERAVGGSLAVRSVAEGGGLMLKAPLPRIEDLRDPATVPLAKDAATDLNRYVNRVGRIVAARSSRPDLQWSFAVLDTPEVNAFSTPGGYVLISRGLLARVDSEAQLAGLLGHEIAHIVNRDAIKVYQLKKSQLCDAMADAHYAEAGGTMAQGAMPVPDALRGPVFDALGGALANGGFLDLDKASDAVVKLVMDKVFDAVNTGFDRQQEFAADQLGVELAVKAGYKNGELEKLLMKLPPGVGLLATHPPPKLRAENLNTWAKSLPAGSFDALELSQATVVIPHPKELKGVHVK